jgi:hypothetical protein
MQNYFDVVQSRTGNAIAGALVYVYDANGALATLYSDNGVTTKANPLTTNADGEYDFFAADGRYSLNIQAVNFTPQAKSGVVLFDPTAASASNSVNFLQSGIGAVTRTAQSKLRDAVSVKDFGAVGDGTTDDTAEIQAVFTALRLTGGDANISRGTYLISAPLTLDYTGQTQEPVTQPLGVNVHGDSAHNTIFNRSGTGFAITSTGGTGVASHIYTVMDGMSFTGAASKGVKLKNHAFTTLSNMTFQGLVTGLELESVLSCKFENLVFGNATNGVEVSKGTGFSDINANYWDNCTFRLLTGRAYSGGDHSGVYFTAVNVEGCGTQGDALTGGFDMTFDGAEGSVGLTIYGGYFEGNAGGWDINLTNTGTEYATHVLIGVNFNRISSSAFVTNNIRSVGKNRIVLIGCTFDHFNTYTPDAGRPYVNADADTIVTCIGCKFKSSVEQGSLRNFDTPLAGSFAAAGTALKLPAGWTSGKDSTGVYTVTHNLGFASVNDYVVTAVSQDTVGTVAQRVVKGGNSFQVVTVAMDGTPTDAPVSFVVTIL